MKFRSIFLVFHLGTGQIILCLEIDRYGFFEADTNISAIHGPIPIFPKFLNLVFCFIIKNMMYFMP